MDENEVKVEGTEGEDDATVAVPPVAPETEGHAMGAEMPAGEDEETEEAPAA